MVKHKALEIGIWWLIPILIMLHFNHSNWNSLINKRFDTVRNRSFLYCSVLSVRFDSFCSCGRCDLLIHFKEMIRRVSFLFTFLTEYTSHSSVKIKHFFKTGKPPEIQTSFIFKNIITWQRQYQKRQRPGGQIIITVGFKEINAKYTSKEKMSMSMSIPFISLRTFKILLGQGQVVKWP